MPLIADALTSTWWVMLLITPALLAILVVGIVAVLAVRRARPEDIPGLVVGVAKAVAALLPAYRRLPRPTLTTRTARTTDRSIDGGDNGGTR
ncbi:hypothetical protein ACIGZJ_32950 [Kitasatospora sp. NPDC052868]|uniref:hypothetical protein n=1 Tax=Kitasatospora sp. NPDC052868 TaxID=3364060 RepID=UPI0037C99121